jgi:hypothetical protein
MSTSTLLAAPQPDNLILNGPIRAPRPPFGACCAEDFEQLQAMTHTQRVEALCQGELSYAQCCKWASWRPREVPLINGEFAFLAAFDPNFCEPRELGDRQTSDTLHAVPEAGNGDERVRDVADELPAAA